MIERINHGHSYISVLQPMRTVAAIAILVSLPALLASGAEDWPRFRGPTGQGDALNDHLPLHWSESEGIKWKTPLPGRGWSSPVVANGRIWLTAAVEKAKDEAKRAELLKSYEKLPINEQFLRFESVTLKAIEVDIESGNVLREITLFEIESPAPIHGLNTYASPTPVLDAANGRLFCHFGTFGTACIDTATGDLVWTRQFELQHVVGPGSSPALNGNLLIIPNDAPTVSTLWRSTPRLARPFGSRTDGPSELKIQINIKLFPRR